MENENTGQKISKNENPVSKDFNAKIKNENQILNAETNETENNGKIPTMSKLEHEIGDEKQEEIISIDEKNKEPSEENHHEDEIHSISSVIKIKKKSFLNDNSNLEKSILTHEKPEADNEEELILITTKQTPLVGGETHFVENSLGSLSNKKLSQEKNLDGNAIKANGEFGNSFEKNILYTDYNLLRSKIFTIFFVV